MNSPSSTWKENLDFHRLIRDSVEPIHFFLFVPLHMLCLGFPTSFFFPPGDFHPPYVNDSIKGVLSFCMALRMVYYFFKERRSKSGHIKSFTLSLQILSVLIVKNNLN